MSVIGDLNIQKLIREDGEYEMKCTRKFTSSGYDFEDREETVIYQVNNREELVWIIFNEVMLNERRINIWGDEQTGIMHIDARIDFNGVSKWLEIRKV